MERTKCIAMILAGGRGERLGSLTTYAAKPAVIFGGRHKIIDFTLNNCRKSGIRNIGVLTQYLPDELHSHLKKTNNTAAKCSIELLPSKANAKYTGTADAVCRNIQFIEQANPEYVLILSGDHIYEMDYRKMLKFHVEKNADVTIASIAVPYHETFRFGILNTEENGLITHFEEKPKIPKSNLASMGVYIFKWDCLKKHLISDSCDKTSSHDFGRNIIPKMLERKEKLYTYTFNGYWKDIGTVYSLWEANMEILHNASEAIALGCLKGVIELHRSAELEIRQSIISDTRNIRGRIANSIISENVSIGEGSVINECVIMPNVNIGKNVWLRNVIVGADASVLDGVEIGNGGGSMTFATDNICSMGISLVAPKICIPKGLHFKSNSHIDKSPTAEPVSLSYDATRIKLSSAYMEY